MNIHKAFLLPSLILLAFSCTSFKIAAQVENCTDTVLDPDDCDSIKLVHNEKNCYCFVCYTKSDKQDIYYCFNPSDFSSYLTSGYDTSNAWDAMLEYGKIIGKPLYGTNPGTIGIEIEENDH